MSDVAERMLGHGIGFSLDMAPDLRNCRIDPTQAAVALLNILLNARDATEFDVLSSPTIARSRSARCASCWMVPPA